MNKLIAFFSLFFIASFSVFGKVRFELKYTDTEGVGFKAPRNAWMKDVAQEAVDILGGIIEQDAYINIEIKSNMNISCAVSYPKYFHIEPENSNQKMILEAHHKIISENTFDDGKLQGQIEFNTNTFSKVYKHFLRRTIIHEITHLLGFIPWKMENKKYPTYNDYDKLLHDGKGKYFLIGEDKLIVNPEFDCSSGLYACGPNIRSLNNGESVTLHCPKKYEAGSSYAHLDAKAHPLSIMNSKGHLEDYPIWNKCELGIMQDMGYKIDWDKYNEFVNQLTSKENVCEDTPEITEKYCFQIIDQNLNGDYGLQAVDKEEDPGYRFLDKLFDHILDFFSN